MTISLEEHVARAISHITKGRTWDYELEIARAAIAAVREREGVDVGVLLDALREARRCLTTTPLRLEIRANIVDRLDVILSGSPVPDPAEAMRAKCEAIAGMFAHSSDLGGEIEIALQIMDAIAALKGNGDGR